MLVEGETLALLWSPRGAVNCRVRRGVSELAGVMSVLTRKVSVISRTVRQMRVLMRRGLNSVIEPDYLGWIIYGKC